MKGSLLRSSFNFLRYLYSSEILAQILLIQFISIPLFVVRDNLDHSSYMYM
jgi:hypothetical protein